MFKLNLTKKQVILLQECVLGRQHLLQLYKYSDPKVDKMCKYFKTILMSHIPYSKAELDFLSNFEIKQRKLLS